MTYRWPIFTGDRVALAPHLDLFMQGVRYGTVAQQMTNEEGARMYLVAINERDALWIEADDLLGAVNARPGGGGLDLSAVPAPHGVPLCGHPEHEAVDGGVTSATYDLLDEG